jgi:hypothetical protein
MNGLKLRKVSQPLQASIGRQWLMMFSKELEASKIRYDQRKAASLSP